MCVANWSLSPSFSRAIPSRRQPSFPVRPHGGNPRWLIYCLRFGEHIPKCLAHPIQKRKARTTKNSSGFQPSPDHSGWLFTKELAWNSQLVCERLNRRTKEAISDEYEMGSGMTLSDSMHTGDKMVGTLGRERDVPHVVWTKFLSLASRLGEGVN